MSNVSYEPYFLPTDGKVTPKTVRRNRNKNLVGFQEFICYLIFDIKLDGNFSCKAHFVADGSKTEAPNNDIN